VATYKAVEEAGARGRFQYGPGLEVHDVNECCLLQRFQLRAALRHAQPHGALDGCRSPCVDLGLGPAGFGGSRSALRELTCGGLSLRSLES
jgi:hypothetical protein